MAEARVIEFDIQLSSDHVPAVIHDETLARTCGVVGKVVILQLPNSQHLAVVMQTASRKRLPTSRLIGSILLCSSFRATRTRFCWQS